MLTMQQELNSSSVADNRLFASAAITLVTLLLVFAAFDDITTDNATTFHIEYMFLVGCAGWLLFVAWSLIRDGHRSLGLASLVALGSAVWAQRALGPDLPPGLRPEYVVIVTGYLWFWALAGALFWLGYRARKRVNPLFTLAAAVGITVECVVIAVLAAGLGLPLFVLLVHTLA